jgi:hypothetical protein
VLPRAERGAHRQQLARVHRLRPELGRRFHPVQEANQVVCLRAPKRHHREDRQRAFHLRLSNEVEADLAEGDRARPRLQREPQRVFRLRPLNEARAGPANPVDDPGLGRQPARRECRRHLLQHQTSELHRQRQNMAVNQRAGRASVQVPVSLGVPRVGQSKVGVEDQSPNLLQLHQARDRLVVPRTFHSKVVVGGQRLNQLYRLRQRVQVRTRAVGVLSSQDNRHNPGSESRPRHRLRALVRARPNVAGKEARAPRVNLADSPGLERLARLSAVSKNQSAERKKARKKHRRQDRNRSGRLS